ncbi:hypothetical protein Droror1_Dr00012064 [Drosera rotundifolia]
MLHRLNQNPIHNQNIFLIQSPQLFKTSPSCNLKRQAETLETTNRTLRSNFSFQLQIDNHDNQNIFLIQSPQLFKTSPGKQQHLKRQTEPYSPIFFFNSKSTTTIASSKSVWEVNSGTE